MPRATEFSLRLVIARMARLGVAPPEIARQLDLPISTVRDLSRRALQAQADERPLVDLAPRYDDCGRPPGPDPPLLQAVLDLRRRHPRWGAMRIRVELTRIAPGATIPSDRTLRSWLHRPGLAPAPPGRPRATSRRRAERPHRTW
jgi:hypothetical protein